MRLTKTLLKFRNAVESFAKEKAAKQGQVSALSSQVVFFTLNEALNQAEASLNAEMLSLKDQHVNITIAFEQAQNAVQENSTKLSSLSGRMEELQKQIKSPQVQKAVLDNQILALLTAEGYSI